MTYKQKNRTAKRSWRKGLSLLLSLAMLAGLLPTMATTASAADTALTPSNNGTVTATNGGSYIISVSGTYTGWRFVVPSGVTATLTVSGTLTLNNQSGGGSPIDVQAGGNLSLVVNGALTVYGQAGTDGAYSVTAGAKAYAGIHVPTGAILSTFGTGVLTAHGGDAGNGGSYIGSSDQGAGGGGGAGAAIGGNGGDGGSASTTTNNNAIGKSGESAGSITLAGNAVVNAYGGGGGAAGNAAVSAGSGSGGYPAAGIGGGGGGAGAGSGDGGGGGFTGAGSEDGSTPGSNGTGSQIPSSNISIYHYRHSGGYFSGANGTVTVDGIATTYHLIGGMGGGNFNSCKGGNGGVAGAGGIVKVYTVSSNIHAYNGNYITTSASGASGNNWGQNPTPIYAQLGYSLDNIRAKGITSVTARTDAAMSSELASKGVAKTIATTGVSGIGSGAGYTESSNGTVQYGTRLDLGTLKADLHLTPSSNGGVPYILYGTQNQYNVVIDSGNVTLILDSATIDMSNQTGKSAIDVKPGASLALEVIGTSKLYGANGVDGGDTVFINDRLPGGAGGQAAISVPTGAGLSMSGAGSIYAYGGDAGNGGGSYNNKSGGVDSGGGGGGGAGAGIGGTGGAGGAGNLKDYVSKAGSALSGSTGIGAGTITLNARVYAYGGSGGSGGGSLGTTAISEGGGGGGGYPAAGIGGGGAGGGGGGHSPSGGGFSSGGAQGWGTGTAGGTNGYGGGADPVGHWSTGGSYFEAGIRGGLLPSNNNAGDIYGGGGDTIHPTNGSGGSGGIGGSGGTITIVDKSLVFAQNGSKITTSTSASQSWAAANATPIRTQASQGYGAGAGYTETDGKVVFMGAPDAPTSVSATLSGTYGDSATVSWNVPAGTGGDGVALTGYTVKSVGFGINRTLAPADYTVAGNRVTVTLTGLPHNTKGTFTVYALNAKGASVESTPSNELTTKGVPLAPKNVEAHMINGTVDKAAALWNGPDISYNNIKMTGDADYGKYRGKARQKQAHFSHRQRQRRTNLFRVRAPCDCAEGA